MKKFLTETERLESLKKRSQLIKESFHKEFNKIKRIDEANLNEDKNWEDTINLENGNESRIFFQQFKLYTNDYGYRYQILVNNKEVSDRDLQNILTMIGKIDRDNSLIVYKIRVEGKQTRIMVGSNKTDDINAVSDIKQKRTEYNPNLF